MNKETLGAFFGTTASAVGTAIQPSEVLQIISLVITIIGSVVTTAMAIIAWYKDAKKDGQITEDEIKEGGNIIINFFKKLFSLFKKGKKDNENKK